MCKLAENVAWACRQWIIAVAALLVLSGAVHAEFLPDQAKDLKFAPEIERLFVIKTAENALTEKERTMLNDPENSKDGYLWARKVIGLHYAGLYHLADELTAPKLGAFYKEKADLFSRNVRGEVSSNQLEPLETALEGRKQSYLSDALTNAKPSQRPDFDMLRSVAKTAADKIHGYSVLLADDASITRKP